MEFTKENLDLMESIIRNDRKFADNEDLFDDFFNEMCKRSVPIVNSITSDTTLKAYLKKIATTSILNVLKESGRLRRTHVGYTSTNEVSLDEIEETNVNSDFYANTKVSYPHVNFDNEPENMAIQNEILQKISSFIEEINNNEPDEQYLRLYKLRYSEGMTQQKIADELGLSQSEVSKRLYKLMAKVRQSFN